MRYFYLALGLLAVVTCQAKTIVATNSTGSAVVTGGEQRCIYVHDPATLQVVRRISVNHKVKALAVNEAGDRVYCFSAVFGGPLEAYELATGKQVLRTEEDTDDKALGRQVFAVAQTADHLVYGTDTHYVLINMATGEEVARRALPDIGETEIVAAALSPDLKTLAIFEKAVKDEAEPKGKPAEGQVKQQVDGKKSTIHFVDMQGDGLRSVTSWIDAQFPYHGIYLYQSDRILRVGDGDGSVSIAFDGTTTALPWLDGERGVGISQDGSTVVTAQRMGQEARVYAMAEKSGRTITLPGDPSGKWVNISERLYVTNTGDVIGCTDAERVFRLKADSSFITADIY